MQFNFLIISLFILTIQIYVFGQNTALPNIKFDQKENYQTYTKQSVKHKANLGSMPVYDQGQRGSCVSEAISAIINVLHYNRSNYVSTSCSLALGSYLSKQNLNYFKNSGNTYLNDIYQYSKTIGRKSYPSGREGSYPYLVTSQIAAFGIIPKSHEYLCNANESESLSPDTAKPLANYPLNSKNWTVICDNGIPGKSCTDDSINKIKTAINKNELIMLGILITKIPMEYQYYEKSHPQKKEANVWAYTKQVHNCVTQKSKNCQKNSIRGGHAVVAYGYRENPFHPNEGIFYIHNSWGEYSGDNGDYYITYRYLQKLLISAIAFSRNP